MGLVLSDVDREALGWTALEAAMILRALGFAPASRGEPMVWRRRNDKPAPVPAPPRPNSPFAALAGFKAGPPRRKRLRRKKPAAS